MPELPEVEVTLRGIEPHLVNRKIIGVNVRTKKLRWPIPILELQGLVGCSIQKIARRAKYLLLDCSSGWLIIHLGMSGTLRVVPQNTKYKKHDHCDLQLSSGQNLRFNDPRRFGAILWEANHPVKHRLIVNLGPEPLDSNFNEIWLFTATRMRTKTIKACLMDSHFISGVGNIYANECLFRANIRPFRSAKSLTKWECKNLSIAIKKTLLSAIRLGGSSIQNFTDAKGYSGYFQNYYSVYNKAGTPCSTCKTLIKKRTMAQRSTFYCPSCQK